MIKNIFWKTAAEKHKQSKARKQFGEKEKREAPANPSTAVNQQQQHNNNNISTEKNNTNKAKLEDNLERTRKGKNLPTPALQ